MENNLAPCKLSKQTHHERLELCTNRPKYRQGRKLTSIKAYCVNDESKYLLIQGVPVVASCDDLKALCISYGSIVYLKPAADYPSESFCQAYVAKFFTVPSARLAKRKMDDKEFFGGILHVCYAPELETLEDTRDKLLTRRREIFNKLNPDRKKRTWLTNKQKEVCVMNDKLNIDQKPSSPTESIKPADNQDSSLQSKANVIHSEASASKANVPATAEQSFSQPRPTPIKRIVYHNLNTSSKKKKL